MGFFDKVEKMNKGKSVNGDYIVDEIVLLGDVKHVIGSVIGQEWSDVLAFFDYLSEKTKKILIVKGQHDALLDSIVRKREKKLNWWITIYLGSMPFCMETRIMKKFMIKRLNIGLWEMHILLLEFRMMMLKARNISAF